MSALDSAAPGDQFAPTKTENLVALLWQCEGATLAQLVEGSGLSRCSVGAWLASTTRRRQTLTVRSRRTLAGRVYATTPERETGYEADLHDLAAVF